MKQAQIPRHNLPSLEVFNLLGGHLHPIVEEQSAIARFSLTILDLGNDGLHVMLAQVLLVTPFLEFHLPLSRTECIY